MRQVSWPLLWLGFCAFACTWAPCYADHTVRKTQRPRKPAVKKPVKHCGNEVPTQPLFRAIAAKDQVRVKKLLASGADPNRADYRYLPLLYAAEHRQPEIMELLIHAGARVNMRLPGGETPLLRTASYGCLQC